MKTFALVVTLVGSLFASAFGAFATVSSERVMITTVAAQGDCKDGEQWNEEKQACEPAADGN
jgi:hypothetical protein